MRHYESTALIEARPDAIWAILADAPGYADWDSGVVIWRSMPDLGPSFEQFARGLKARAERSA